jgi:mannosyltransferase OCH1-like enzyme
MEAWSRGCREIHDDWEHVLWTDDDNLLLVTKYFRWLLPTYLSLKGPIMQADLMRNVYMYLYGGLVGNLKSTFRRANESR